ncbi:MAG: GLPGLI family protein [Bacteroides pyogenes]|uniref:GLPGLI family protein n=1 Tax=Bacteroides TaxID=816 RepID=UPI0023F73CF2|nr:MULTISPECIES: GLPGLI family protein [Bacteroides]MCI6213619.1 GLPGLI family protein [Bacteroides heparinolyticus]MCI7071778.1 GLPGLI family protein [Bacteroides pyogenes]
MKKFFLNAICLMAPLCAWSQVAHFDNRQFNVLDSANYRFTYHLKFIPDSLYGMKTLDSEHVLLIGNKYSKFFNSQYTVKTDGTKSFQKNIDSRGIGDIEIIKNTQAGKMTVVQMNMTGKWEYEEAIPNIQWKITNEKKIIKGYQCQKAVCDYLGRTYEAWFTSAIPVNNGPWKFGNLPGLILDVSDVRGHYHFSCVGIEKSTQKEPIVKYSVKSERTNRIKLNKTMKRYHDNPVAYLKAMYGNNVSVRGGDGSKNVSFPYNPIELE